MKLSSIRTTCKNFWDNLRKSRSFLVLLLSFAVIVGQVFPMQASHLRYADSDWIEICGGENGSYLIQAGQPGEGSKQDHDCSDCSLCAGFGNGANIAPVTGRDMLQLSVFADFAFAQDYAVFTDRPEKHWSTSRAPPYKSINRIPVLSNPVSLKPLQNEYPEGVQPSQAGTL